MGTGNLSWQCNIQYIPISCYIYSPVIKHGNGQFPIYFIYGYILPTMPHLIAGPPLVALVPQVLKQSSQQFGDGSSICTRCLELSWNTTGGPAKFVLKRWMTCMGLLYFDLQNLRMMITVGHVLSFCRSFDHMFIHFLLETSWDILRHPSKHQGFRPPLRPPPAGGRQELARLSGVPQGQIYLEQRLGDQQPRWPAATAGGKATARYRCLEMRRVPKNGKEMWIRNIKINILKVHSVHWYSIFVP